MMREPGGWSENAAEGADGDLRADVGLDANLCGRSVEARDAVETVAVGEGECGHAELGCTLDERLRLRCSGEKAEGAGGVELDVGFSHRVLPDASR